MSLRLARGFMLVSLAVLVTVSLTGCKTPAEECQEKGGKYVQTGIQTYYVQQKIGENMSIMVPQTYPTYDCEMPR